MGLSNTRPENVLDFYQWGRMNFGPTVRFARPELLILVGSIIAYEAMLNSIFLDCLEEVYKELGEERFNAYQSLSGRTASNKEKKKQQLIKDASEVFDGPQLDVLSLVHDAFFIHFKEIRNKLAHREWGWADIEPNCILLKDRISTQLRRKNFEQHVKNKASFYNDKGEFNANEFLRSMMNPEGALVSYRENNFTSVLELGDLIYDVLCFLNFTLISNDKEMQGQLEHKVHILVNFLES